MRLPANATEWESVGVVATAIITGIALLYTFTARPKLRTFYDVARVKRNGTWVGLGVIVYVANVGRAATVLRSAGLRSLDGGVNFAANFPPELADRYTHGGAPMVLKPGELVAYFVDTPLVRGDADRLGAAELRTWRFGRAAARLPRGVRATLPAWTKTTWHKANGPDPAPPSPSP